MPTPTFDLIEVIRTLRSRRSFIIIITVAAMLLGGVFFVVKKKKYKAAAVFLVNNPLYGDRNSLFRNYEQRYVDYFGGDDDLDRVTSFLNSDTVRDRIIRNCQFQVVYNQDINSPNGHAQLMNIFGRNFNVKRSEYKDMEVSYIAYDSVTAANVANTAVKVAEETFRSYYTNMKDGMYASINAKVKQLDSAIALYTDSLANMRDRSGIYGIISPVRQNTISGDVKASGKGMGRAVEEIQNVESLKDQLVMDRAHYVSLMNEFAATTNSSMEYIKVISRAVPPSGPTGPSMMMMLIISGGLGLFFSAVYVLLMAYYRLLNSVQR